MKPAFARVGRCGKTIAHYMNLAFFACEGLVACHDERPEHGDYTVHLPDDILRRVKRLALGLKRFKADDKPWARQERQDQLSQLQKVEEVVKEAKAMGDPSDPAVQAFWQLHQPGRKSTVRLRAGSDRKGYPDLPIIPLGKPTGRTAKSDGRMQPVREPKVNDDEYLIHQRPRRKPRTKGLILDL